MHLQDLQPDAAINLGMVKSPILIRGFKFLETVAYRGAWRISSVSGGMLDVLRKRGVPEAKLRYFPNGTNPAVEVPSGRFRALNRFDADKFLVVYSGNLGVKQGLHQLILAARQVRNPGVLLIICGEGAEKKRLLEMAARIGNVWFKGVLEIKDYKEMLAHADLIVVSVISGSGSAFFPSKFLSACSAGRPVVAILVTSIQNLQPSSKQIAAGLLFGRAISKALHDGWKSYPTIAGNWNQWGEPPSS